MQEKINLEEILNYYTDESVVKDKAAIYEAMKEACRQILKLAAENAKITEINSIPEDSIDRVFKDNKQMPDEEFIISKQSILNTINQIE